MVSYELIGSKEKSVAIIQSSNNLKKDKQIAKKLVKLHKSIRSVLVKSSIRKGILRKREYKLIFGNKNTEVIHKEYGYLIKLDPQKIYFSPRELTERQRIAKQVKKNEKVLVMFSGAAPFIVAIKKNEPSAILTGIELNKLAHNYAKENIKLNKLRDITLYQGDVRKIIPKMKDKFDRILMPLPRDSYKFLSLAFKVIKKNGTIHYYSFDAKSEFKKIKDYIKEQANKSHKTIRILRLKKVLPYGPKIYKIALDIKCN